MAPLITPQVESAAGTIAGAALARVQEPGTGRVRVEDYLASLAAVAGEAALLAAKVLDIETSDIPPGAPVFGDRINELLTGDTVELEAVPADSTVGVLVAELVPGTASRGDFGSLAQLYTGVAERVGAGGWGHVGTTVPAENQPAILPIQVAFELRPTVDAALAASGLQPPQRHVLCAVALAIAIRQVRDAIDMSIAMTLALEVLFGAAKMMPMSRRAFDEARRTASAQ